MLNEPMMHYNLTLPFKGDPTNEANIVNAHCMDFPEDELDKFYIGSEDYNIY